MSHTPKKASEDNTRQACDKSLTRKEFVTVVLKRAAIAGGVLAAPKVLDKFLIPAAWAFGSSCSTSGVAMADTNTWIAGYDASSSVVNNDSNPHAMPGAGGFYIETNGNTDTFCGTGGA